MDRHRCLERRHLDVQRSLRVADDEPQPRSADRITGSGSD